MHSCLPADGTYGRGNVIADAARNIALPTQQGMPLPLVLTGPGSHFVSASSMLAGSVALHRQESRNKRQRAQSMGPAGVAQSSAEPTLISVGPPVDERLLGMLSQQTQLLSDYKGRGQQES